MMNLKVLRARHHRVATTGTCIETWGHYSDISRVASWANINSIECLTQSISAPPSLSHRSSDSSDSDDDSSDSEDEQEGGGRDESGEVAKRSKKRRKKRSRTRYVRSNLLII